MPTDITTRADVEHLVHTFYQELQKNPQLDMMFNQVAQIHWESHLPRMCDFWESVLFGKGVFKGNPMKVHQDVHAKHAITADMFTDWLTLFRATVDTHFEGPTAEKAKQSAHSIAAMLQIKLK
jgi:hemoglobin